MKKETVIFLIILIGWLSLLNFAILKTVVLQYAKDFNSVVIKDLFSGAAVYYPLNTNSLLTVIIIPLFVFNALVIIFLSLSYYFFLKSKKLDLRYKKAIASKKGQAAMEFLMTYGWAIMAFIISLLALTYFNATPLRSPTGQSFCALSPGFTCKDFIVGASGVSLIIENGLGVNLLDVTANITNSPQGPCVESTPPKRLDDKKSESFFVPCQNIKEIGSKFKGDIVVKYRKEGSALSSTSTGLIATKVESYTYNDIDAPVITITEPQEGQAYETWYFDLEYTATDLNLSSCWYKLDNGNNVNLPNCQDQSNINSGSAGSHTVTVYANDTNNNVGSKSVTFTTSGSAPQPPDTQPPTWSNPNTVPGSPKQNDNTTFITTWSDNTNLAGYQLSINQNGIFINQSYSTSFDSFNRTLTAVVITAPTGTIVYWQYTANDTSGNMGKTNVFFFQVASSGGGPPGGDNGVPVGGG